MIRAAPDFALYYELAKASGNRIFVFTLNTVRQVMQQVIGLYSQLADNSRTSLDLYYRLLEALRNKDADTAEELFEQQARQDDLLLSSMMDGMG
ncbi:MAG: FCD domain-containing protein [Candidatus Alcyoniella australis]|nr:FCD domain-containing protein [Candidatus Alcyoniella australis]